MKPFTKTLVATATVVAMSLLSTSSAIAKPQMPNHAVQPAMSFSFAIDSNAAINLAEQAVSSESNEYWITVSGRELNRGVDIHTTAAGALIKISRSGNQPAIAAQSLKLFSAKQPQTNLAGKIIGEQDLKTTGVFANASAIKMDPSLAAGKYRLQYEAITAINSQFVIHVKEKQSADKLLMSTQKQHVLQGETLTFDAFMNNNGKALANQKLTAYVLSPTGTKTPVAVKAAKNGKAQISIADYTNALTEVVTPRNGLYELHIDGVAQRQGLEVHRSGKLAFALAERTAKLVAPKTIQISPLKAQTDITLAVNEPGRYEVRGIVYGHDSDGQLKPIMETHSAKNLALGKQSITMEFNQKLLSQSNLSAPYEVKELRLYDQTRMSRL